MNRKLFTIILGVSLLMLIFTGCEPLPPYEPVQQQPQTRPEPPVPPVPQQQPDISVTLLSEIHKILQTSNSQLIIKPLTADLIIEQTKVTATIEDNIGGQVTIESLKNRAIRAALNQKNGDILIDPQFVIVQPSARRAPSRHSVTVTGYPARYSNIREVR